jgi:hypothetical protein
MHYILNWRLDSNSAKYFWRQKTNFELLLDEILLYDL